MFNFFKKSKQEQDSINNQEKTKSFWNISFSDLKQTISSTTKNFFGNIDSILSEEEFTDEIIDDIEDSLIKSDLGVDLSAYITDKIRGNNKIKPSEFKDYLKEEFNEILNKAGSNELKFNEEGLTIYLITGVNGGGKTTLIAKLANKFQLSGKKVLLAAADTFRAAAEEQLDIWAKRANVDIVRKDGIDSAAVVFDAIKKAKNENYDILLIDTAGRLQNKQNLMQELNKIKNIIEKLAPKCLMESILVLDANTGQNGLSQAKLFSDAVNLTSVALTKLDGSAKGGIVIAIAKELKLPVKLIGIGEKIEDLKLFNSNDFLNALFEI